MAWLIRTFTSDTGAKPVEEWIKSLDPSAQFEVDVLLRRLRVEGVGLGMPQVRHIEEGIWELRIHDPAGRYRVLYFHWKGRTFGILHGFTKQTPTTPRSELNIAKSRRALWLKRAARRVKGGTETHGRP